MSNKKSPKKDQPVDPLDSLMGGGGLDFNTDFAMPGDDSEIDIPGMEDDEEEDPNSPLKNVEYEGKFAPDAAKELNAMQQAFKDRAQREQKRFELATDSEYWLCACFMTREQKDAFLFALGMDPGEKYIDARILAKKLGITLPDDPQFSEPKVDMSWYRDFGD